MKKTLLLVLILTLILCGCDKTQEKASDSLSSEGVESITIQIPPGKKTIDKEEDIEDIIERINDISKKEREFERINGWEIRIQTYGEQEHSISFCGNILTIDDKQYTIDEKAVDKMRELYNELTYTETDCFS